MDGAQIHPPGRQRGAPPLLPLPNAARRAPPRTAGPRLEAPRLVAAAPAQGLEGFRGVPVRDLHRDPPHRAPPPRWPDYAIEEPPPSLRRRRSRRVAAGVAAAAAESAAAPS